MLLSLSNFSLSIGSTQLLDSVSAQITETNVIGLVGKNGSGKSTLMKSILSSDKNYGVVGSGKITGKLSPEKRPKNSVLLVDQDKLDWTKLFPSLPIDLDVDDLTVDELLDLASSYDSSIVEDAENWRQLSVDNNLWSSCKYEEIAIKNLSPGLEKRAYLAIAINKYSLELFLLDEPTNHLDLATIIWLEKEIKASKKAFIIVSHDEAFLNSVVDQIWAIDTDFYALHVSHTDYSTYINHQNLAKERQRHEYEHQISKLDRLNASANKLREHSTAGTFYVAPDPNKLGRDFARDRAGRSGKKAKAIQKRIDSEVLIDRVIDHVPLKIDLEPLGGNGNDASIMTDNIRLQPIGCSAPLNIPPITLRIDYGERVVIIGNNGVGKSTLLKTITNQISSENGVVSIGRELIVGHLTQEHEQVPRDLTPREYLASVTGKRNFDVGQKLFKYGLIRRQLDLPIEQLNPGNRVRLLLASFSLRKVNCLIMDEPTNHLDKEAILEVTATMNSYKGTIIVVSHNRHFLEQLNMNRVLLLESDVGLREITLDEYLNSMDDNEY